MVWPSAPVLWLPSPWRPRSALCSGLKRKRSSVLACWLATRITSPPRPPSPPLGPPRGTYFSLRNARQPLPPSPALTRILTSSINMLVQTMFGQTRKSRRSLSKPAARENRHGAQGTAAYATAVTLTNLPIRPRSLNSTTPVTLANNVSSLPQPTLVPGFSLVPRWRTMMEPPGTSWPPNTFTPSRCALESRPFLELPNPFLCAIRHLHHNVADLHLRVGLAMADGFLVLLLALELEDDDFGPAAVCHNGGHHLAARYQFAAFLERSLGGQFDFRADIAG